MYQVSFFVSTTPSLSGAAAAGQATENQGWQHEQEQHREHEQHSGDRKELPGVPPRSQDQPGRGPVWPAYCGPLCGGGDGLASLDGSVDGVGGAGHLRQAAFFLIVQS